jgi:RNase adaptor protein for sRNA GlmZ degradation
MTDQDLTPLDLATQERCREVRRRAEGAIRQLDARGMPINFASVASAATVSRSWLYRDANIRASIERLRTVRRSQPIPATQRASADSIRRQREALLDEIARLTHENKQLRAEVAKVFGDRRSART